MITSNGITETPLKGRRRPTRWQFIIGWVVLLALHGLCLGYYVGVGILYHTFLPKSANTLVYEFRTYSIGIPETEYSKVAIVHVIVAAIHALFILIMLGGSLQTRKFVFYLDWRPMWQSTNLMMSALCKKYSPRKNGMESTRSASDSSMGRTISGKLVRTGSAIFGKEGLLGVDSIYFDHITLVREFVETSLQTYQAYRMSRLLPRLWLIRLFVLLLVANCWLVPILHRVYTSNHRIRRMMSLVCDVVLDLISSIGISFFIFATYVPQYNDPNFGFPLQNFYIDEWFISLYQEFQLMVIISWSDMGSRLVFAFGVLQGMESIKELMTDAFEEKPSHPDMLVRQIAPANVDAPPPQPVLVKQRQKPIHKIIHVMLHIVGPACFVIWGCIILVIHIYAEAHYVNLPCKLPLRPWLNTNAACSLVEIDCHHASGSVSLTNDDWTVFDPSLAAGLIVRHCTDLTVPPTMQSFTSLITLKMYNTTITSWPTNAGLSSAQVRLRAIYMIRTNFTSGVIPPGLERHDFPSSVSSLVASVTNLVSLPDTLDTAWPKHMSIAIEFASLTSIPEVLLRLNPSLVSFAYTPITSVPATLFQLSGLRNMLLSYTAIQELPRNVTKLSPGIDAIGLEGTNVSSFWAWLDPLFLRAYTIPKWCVLSANTPYCRERVEILNGTRQQFSTDPTATNLASVMDISTPTRRAYSLGSVVCMPVVQMLFPLPLEDAMSQIRE